MRRNLILYFTLGYPDQDTLEKFINSIDGEAVDYVEFGFPSESPVYDGPRIRKTHRSAAENYDPSRNSEIFSSLLEKGIKLFSLTYYRDIERNDEEFLSYLKDSGFSGIIVPDLLVDFGESSGAIIDRIQSAGLDFIPFFNPATPDSVIRDIAGKTGSWIYYGLQPSTGINVPFDVEEVVERSRDLLADREVNYGFGIRNSEQVRELSMHGASGVAIGTAFIDMLASGDVDAFTLYMNDMRGVLDEN